MRIYLDTCCYGRQFDNQAHQVQVSVRQEVAAIINAIQICGASGVPIIGSPAVIVEIDDIKSPEKRERVRAFYDSVVNVELVETDAITVRMMELKALGFKGIDAYHAAFAEASGAGFLLTTDSRFERTAGRQDLKTKVINPINFLGEYLIWQLLST